MPSAPVSVQELVTRYLRDCRLRGLAPTTLHTYQHNLEVIFLPWCREAGIASVDDVTQEALDHYTDHLMTRPKVNGRGGSLSRATITGYLDSVRNMLVWSQRRGSGTSGRPLIPLKEKAVKQILTREELARMEDAATTERDKLIVRLFGDRGLRLMELVLLDASDLVELQRGKWFLRVRGKGSGGQGNERFVPVPYIWKRLQRLTQLRRASDDALFVSLRKRRDGQYHRITPSGVEQVVKWTAKAAGIERRVHPHLLRHSAITHYMGKGLNEAQAKMIFGNYTALNSYVHLTPLNAYEWMSRMDG